MTELIEVSGYTLVCVLAECDPITYEEIAQDTKLQKAMNEETKAIT